MPSIPSAPTDCRICGRVTLHETDLCAYHAQARSNLQTTFKKWQNSYGQLTWRDYLVRLKQLPDTGAWVKEVIETELGNVGGGE